MELTDEQAQHLYEKGYVHLRGAVSPDGVRLALRRINNALAAGMDPGQMVRYSAQSFVPEIGSSPELLDLLNQSPARGILQWAMGLHDYELAHSAQIALRFPRLEVSPKDPPPHIDGTYSPTNGVRPGSFDSFTALCGIFLSELTEENCGNFVVWPGSHKVISEYARDNGWESITSGLTEIDLPSPLQIRAQPGDIVIAHHLLAHSVARHVGPNIRYACFFRIRHPEHNEHRPQAIVDPWLEWPGLRAKLGIGVGAG